MSTLGNAARDVDIDHLIILWMNIDHALDQSHPLFPVMRIWNINFRQTTEQACQMMLGGAGFVSYRGFNDNPIT